MKKIEALFATPIYLSNMERDFSIEELECVNYHKKKFNINTGKNKTSKNNFILKQNKMKSLHKDLMVKVNDYFKSVEDSNDEVELYITQSWLNYNESNTHHHEHWHTNSYISGVLYIKANENLDFIRFLNPRYSFFEFSNKNNFNVFNSGIWDFPVKSGSIILFPSYLRHSVENNSSDYERISLAFNVFVKGIIGNENELTQLKTGI
tara:strand:- start:1485 stop:2105 length:621 start_codon:yes stop_codon:yes gene_type:complete